ncbi:MAG: RNA pyrophosphohydrolase [Proteobacteria bacterium]|jgi:putative (di)nucleoside polyphosphate hydrolase|nr:RNA pyrophosphohydrolase [Alphaproteobacteria bacterium]NCC03275.1 RNA pyrophosphohydrolase [Pseudomonadota bacterium]
MPTQVTDLGSGLPYRNSVGMCVFNPKGLVFCAERRDRRGAWQMPQGGIQVGEDPSVAVFRELKEEIGTDQAVLIAKHPEKLRYEFPDYLQYKNGVFHGKYRGQEQTWFALLYTGSDSDIDLSGKFEAELPEFVNWEWLPIEEVTPLIVDFKRGVYQSVVKAFSPLSIMLARGEDVPQWSA